jgi:hypothetical protein
MTLLLALARLLASSRLLGECSKTPKYDLHSGPYHLIAVLLMNALRSDETNPTRTRPPARGR